MNMIPLRLGLSSIMLNFFAFLLLPAANLKQTMPINQSSVQSLFIGIYL